MIYTFDNWAKFPILIVFSFVLFIVGCDLRGGKSEPSELSFSPFPANNFRRVPINTTIRAVFQSPLDPQSIHPDLFLLIDSSGNKVPCKLDYTPFPDSGTFVLILTPLSYSQTPPAYLNPDTTYTVVLGAGIKSQAGDAQTGLNTWSFKTNTSADFVPPTIYGLSTAQGVDMGSIKLTWGPAVDNPGGTPSDQLIFSICYSTSALVCQTRYVPVLSSSSFSTDSNGNFFYVVKSLKPETTYYFVVRAEDLAGNRETNTVVVNGKTMGGKLYVSNFGNNEILAFDHPSKLSQTVSARSIKALQSGMTQPYGIFYDPLNKRLYISTCQLTGSNSLVLVQDRQLCVTGTSKIVVYDNVDDPSKLPGRDQIPTRTILDTKLNGPVGLYLDSSSDTLYVADFVGSSVRIYPDVTNRCGNTTCTLTGTPLTSADLTAPFGIAFDSSRNLLYVSNYVNIFYKVDSVGTVTDFKPGTKVVVFSKTGSTWTQLKVIDGFNLPAGLWLDTPSDTLYVANAGASLVPPLSLIKYPGIVAICNMSVASMDPTIFSIPASSTPCTPTSTSAAQFLVWPYDFNKKTGFILPIQMAVTMATSSSIPSLYVSDYGANSIDVFSPNPLFSATTVYNNTPPNEVLYGLNNEIQKPIGITVSDSPSGSDNLYVVNSGWNQILFFDQIAQNYTQCAGTSPSRCNFPPARLISPAISGTTGLFLNNSLGTAGIPRDRLYVSNFFNNSIVILDGASTLNGNSYNAIYKIVTSSALQNPFGIFVDTSQSREWIYVVNSRPDTTGPYSGRYAILVFDLSQCPADPDPKRCDMPPLRTIHSSDLSYPAGIWVDEGVDSNNPSRDLLFVSNRGATSFSSPGSIAIFKNSSTLNGSVPATILIAGDQGFDQTSLVSPAGLLLDPVTDQLYVANEGHNTVVVFNRPQDCKADAVTHICNIPPDRVIYNTSDITRSLDAPSSLAINFSANQMYVSNLGLFNFFPSLLIFDQATSANGESTVINYFFSSLLNNTLPFALNFPEAIVLDTLR